MKNQPCCVSGCLETATKTKQSIIGQLFYPVCDNHDESLSSAMGYCDIIKHPRIGLIDKDGKFVEITQALSENII